jgi:radical SAM superfamily enzyme YgiQ (UPF0313 family)
VAYSITTGRHDAYQQLNLTLKKQCNFIAVFGGPHATFFPDFIQEDGVDVLCRGEGEGAILELANSLDSDVDISSIPNMWVKSGRTIHKNPVRPLISNLDTLPFVSRDLVNKYDHYRKLHRRMVLTGRGCPYQCTYCFNHVYNDFYKGKGPIVRRRSVDNVIRELQTVREEYHPRRFQFVDDTFILDHDWCMEFCDRYATEVGLPFIVYARVNLVSDELIRRLKFWMAPYAIESGNDRIRNEFKRNLIGNKSLVPRSCSGNTD